MTTRLSVVGSLNMDLVIRAPRIPQPGETIIGSQYQTVPGGKGANQAVAAARLGTQVSMIGRVGSDAFGAQLIENLSADGIDHTHVIQDQNTASGVALIVVDDAGQNSIVVASGANMSLSPGDVSAAEAAIAGADALLLQLENPIETVTRAAQIASAHGVTVVLNPAPARAVPTELLALIDVLIPNESETELLSGMPVENQVQARAAAESLRARGVGTVILTLGERGALLARESGAELLPAFVITPVDTTAAGDAFVAGFAVALAGGSELAEAVHWGNAAGALATTKLGAQPSLPTRNELEQMLGTGTLAAP